MINGFLNINKPDGITSFGVIAKLRKKFNIKKIGHMGTLDPAGSGVLPLAIGKTTKLFDLMQQKRKKYRAIFVFGKETDTLDSEGQIRKENNKVVTEDQINSVLKYFIGKIKQVPPNFSAKKINGKRAYDLARENKEVKLEAKEIEIFDFKLIDKLKENQFLFEIECSSGTYIRSLCRDIAIELGTVAYMPLIIRTKCDKFEIENSVSLCEILEYEQKLEYYLIPLDKVFNFEKIVLNQNDFKKIRNGLNIDFKKGNDGLKFLLFENNIFAIGKVANGKLGMEIYLDD